MTSPPSDDPLWTQVDDLPLAAYQRSLLESQFFQLPPLSPHPASTTTSYADPPPQPHSQRGILAQPLMALLSPSPSRSHLAFPRVYPDLPRTPPPTQRASPYAEYSMPGSFEAYRSLADTPDFWTYDDSPPTEMRQVRRAAPEEDSPSVRMGVRRVSPTGGAKLARLASEMSIGDSPQQAAKRARRGFERVDSAATDATATSMGVDSLFDEEGKDTPCTTPEESPSPPALPLAIPPLRPAPPTPTLSLRPPSDLVPLLARLPFPLLHTLYRQHALSLLPWSALQTPASLSLLSDLALSTTTTTTNPKPKSTLLERASDFLPPGQSWKVSRSERRAWAAIDAEELAFAQGRFLGEDDGAESPAWGGRVRFKATVSPSSPGSTTLALGLLPPAYAIGNSNRLTRLYGSRAFLVLALDSSVVRRRTAEDVGEVMRGGVEIGGERWVPVFEKDGGVVCVCARVVRERVRARRRRAMLPLSLAAEEEEEEEDEWFVGWVEEMNAMGLNGRQAMGKWAKRFELLWSPSLPGPRVRPEDILSLPDIVSPECILLPPSLVPAQKTFTDGSGLMTTGVARAVQKRFGARFPPSAIQVRHRGAKGLLVLCPPEMDDERVCRVWIRPSQVKILYPPGPYADPGLAQALETIDVLSTSALTAPARLTTQLLILLSAGGVPTPPLIRLMSASLLRAVKPLLDPSAPGAQLAAAIEELGAILPGRIRRAGAGLRGRAVDDGETVEEVGFGSGGGAGEGGQPASFEECAFGALLCGHRVGESAFLRRQVRFVLKGVVDGRVGDMKVPVQMSVEGLMVPDPMGVLQEGEIHCELREDYEYEEGKFMRFVLGDVLVTRHPCKLPTDVRKMRAVNHPALTGRWPGVVIFSVKGTRSPASILAGGDYDGDRATVIFDPELVGEFTNADLSAADEPEGFSDCIEKENTMVSDVAESMVVLSPEEQRRTLQGYLLAGVKTEYVMQKYSGFHDVALFRKGAKHPETIRLAHIYNLCLDSSKSGKRIKRSVYQKDIDDWSIYVHPWKPKPDDYALNLRTPTRDEQLGPFVLDQFRAKGQRLGARILEIFDSRFPDAVFHEADLLQPWTDFVTTRANPDDALDMFLHARNAIESHVKNALEKFKTTMSMLWNKNVNRKQKMDELRDFYASGPALDDWKRCLGRDELETLKASYAYTIDVTDSGRPGTRGNFAYDVAFWTICAIKAREHDSGSVTITGAGYTILKINKGLLKHINQYSYDEDA